MIGRLTLEQYARRAHAAAAEGDHSHFSDAIHSLKRAAQRHDNAHAWLEIAVLLTGEGTPEAVRDALERAERSDETITNEALFPALLLHAGALDQGDATKAAHTASAAGGVAALIAGESILPIAPRLAARCAAAISPDSLPVSLISRAWRLRAQTAPNRGEAHAAWQFAIRQAHYADRQRYLLQYTSELLQVGALHAAKKQFTTLQQFGQLPPAEATHAQLLLARIQYASGNIHEAHLLVTNADFNVAEEPVRDEAQLLRADIAQALGNPREEAELLAPLLAQHAHLLSRYVHALQASEQTAAAVATLEAAGDRASANDLELAHAEHALACGDTFLAEQLAEHVFEQTGATAAAFILAHIAETTGGYETAIERYVHITHHAPDSAEAVTASVRALELHAVAPGHLVERDIRRLAKRVLTHADEWSSERAVAENALRALEHDRTVDQEYFVN